MTKNEMELVQAFTNLENKIALMDKAINVCERLELQKWSYYDANFIPVKICLENFKKKFFNILIDIEDSKE